jgi:beta-glucanase (GH16 family)
MRFLFLCGLCVALAAPVCATDWKLVWSDEFDKPGLPDATKWGYETGFVRNHEKQFYTDRRLENARVENGTLIIEARKEQYKDAEYTSASLTTQGKASWTYGRIEMRAKLPTGRGIWPAFWTLGAEHGKGAWWPACGEIDIMELVGFHPETVEAHCHTTSYSHAKAKGARTTVAKPWEDFHIYAMEWFPDRIDFYLDQKKYFTFTNDGTADGWPFDKPQYIILNTAIGGAWGGQQGIDDSIFPQPYVIDYVRVYQQAPAK